MNTLCFAQDIPKRTPEISPKSQPDSLNIDQSNRLSPTVNERFQDTVKVDTTRTGDAFLEAPVKYTATDYVSINQRDEKIYLYNNAVVIYKDMQISAGIIVIDYSTNEVFAGRIKDSLGNYSQHPVFQQGQDVIEPDSIRFNFDSRRALVWNSKTEQQGGTIIAERTKKENDSVYFISRGRYTTAEDLEDPEYYFLIRKGKVVPGKKVVTGLTNMFIYDVPTPIGLPFGFFPLTNKRTSGLIIPSFGEDTANDRGYFLQNGGYYFAVSDNVDLA
ncbi:MAG: LPS-assembly protein LptD, partial [Flavobacteriaceae bacterium]|nr:LPS-assembly protein LptD [Flavobacteriaceae bacterium]